MEDKRLREALQYFFDMFNVDPSDIEYVHYLEEKLIKAYVKVKEHNLSLEEVYSGLERIVPVFKEEYDRLKKNISEMSSSSDTCFGISICFELIDLFEIMKRCQNREEFIAKRDEYFDSLSRDSRFSNMSNYIFPGLEDITYDEIVNIYNNIISNVDYITPEWAGKMRCIIDIRKPLIVDNEINEEIFNFEMLDKVANFARSHNMKLRMHNIIWHLDFRPILKSASKEEIYMFLDTYMKKLSERYSDVFYSIDVLNEIASDESNQVLRDSEWKDKLGENYYIDILRIARKNFPNIPLYYNEFGEENEEKRKRIIEIIEKIKAVEEQEGIILLDGIGIQSHYSTQTTDESIKNAYFDYYRTGKKMQITEFDVSNNGMCVDFDYQTNRVYRTVLDCAATYGVNLINLWGVSSKISWKSERVNCFLDDKGNVSSYAEKLVSSYSQVRKKDVQVDKRANNDLRGSLSKN